MKIIEALKRLKVIEKRMQGNANKVTEYAAYVNSERTVFETEERQKAEVKGLLQANEDLATEYAKLKANIDFTNLMVKVEMGGTTYRINDLLIIKRKLAQLMQMTYMALNTQMADARLRGAPTIGEKRPQVIRLYDEELKNDKLRKWQDLHDNIDSRLEVLNATTEIQEATA